MTTTDTKSTSKATGGNQPEAVDVASAVPRRRPLQWVFTAVVLVLAAQMVWFLVGNERFQWDVVREWFAVGSVMRGLGMTLALTAVAMAVGVLLGTVAAVMRLSDNPVARGVGFTYVWVFRSVPPLVQLILWYNLAYLVPAISLGIPFGPTFVTWDTNGLITPFTAAVLGLGLNEGAYMAEIVRAGLLSVDPGQQEAAKSLGLKPSHAFFRVVLPQAMRVIIPPTGSQVITLLKGTSLVSVIAMSDLLFSVQTIYNRTFEIIPMLLVASLWYLIIVSVLSVAQSRLEKRFARGATRGGSTPARRRSFARPIRQERPV
ncbi:MAG: amino acid ABC transporter permease [Streptomycetaceae bacterium]|nr:amino acid ABC transporter permease [Streptomycetaceae bacterium]